MTENQQNCVNCILAGKKTGKVKAGYGQFQRNSAHSTHTTESFQLFAIKKAPLSFYIESIDAFTKFVWLYPTKSTGILKIFDKLIAKDHL